MCESDYCEHTVLLLLSEGENALHFRDFNQSEWVIWNYPSSLVSD